MSLQTWGLIILAWGVGVWFGLALCKAAVTRARKIEHMVLDMDHSKHNCIEEARKGR